MQPFKIFLAGILVFAINKIFAQTALPDVVLKNMRSQMVPFSSITKNDSLVLICFWSVASNTSMDELNAINSHLPKWKKQTSFKFIAVAVDNDVEADKVRPIANMNGWQSDFEVYIDINGDLRKALSSVSIPQAVVIKNRKLVYQQSGYEKGAENYLLKKLLENSSGK